MTTSLALVNGTIWTGRGMRAQAVAFRNDRIVAVGADHEMRDFIGAQTEVVDLRGSFVCPGFHDAHLHFWGGGRRLLHLDLSGLRSLNELRERVAARIVTTPPGEWITGWGWDHTLWGAREFPTRHDLDDLTQHHPVCLTRTDGHTRWYNSAALRSAGITRATPDPPGGMIIRDAAGEPTGVLTERAIDLVPVRANEPSRRNCLLAALAEARRCGVTSIGDGSADFEAYDALLREELLTVRVYPWGHLNGDWEKWENLRKELSNLATLGRGASAQSSQLLRLGFLKAFLDGSLGSRTAAMLEPYADAPDQSGLRLMETQQLVELIAEADRRGFQVGLHAIGDAAVRQALDAVQIAGSKQERPRVEHVQFVHPDDFERLGNLGVIASVQPCHLMSDLRVAEARVGRLRCLERGYRWRSLAELAAAIPLGTDWPVESLNPFENLYAAVTRCDLDGNPAWPAEESLTIERALRAYTYDAAYAEFAEHERGTIEVGKLADLAVIDRDLTAIPSHELKSARIVMTVFGGRIVYRDNG